MSKLRYEFYKKLTTYVSKKSHSMRQTDGYAYVTQNGIPVVYQDILFSYVDKLGEHFVVYWRVNYCVIDKGSKQEQQAMNLIEEHERKEKERLEKIEEEHRKEHAKRVAEVADALADY